MIQIFFFFLLLLKIESLRMHGLVMVPRIAKQDLWLKGIKISKGSTLFASPHMTMKDPNFYERPDDFIAERFTNEYKNQHSFVDANRNFLPAGLSRWNCPGIGITITMMSVLTSRLLKEFDFKVVGEFPKANISLVVLAPNYPVKLQWSSKHQK